MFQRTFIERVDRIIYGFVLKHKHYVKNWTLIRKLTKDGLKMPDTKYTLKTKDLNLIKCNSIVFWNHTWRAVCTKISELNLSAFIYRLFHEDFSSIVGINRVQYIVLIVLIPIIEEKSS